MILHTIVDQEPVLVPPKDMRAALFASSEVTCYETMIWNWHSVCSSFPTPYYANRKRGTGWQSRASRQALPKRSSWVRAQRSTAPRFDKTWKTFARKTPLCGSKVLRQRRSPVGIGVSSPPPTHQSGSRLGSPDSAAELACREN